MKVFKKIVALVIVLVMSLSVSYSFVGCKKKDKVDDTTPSTDEQTPPPVDPDPVAVALTSAEAKAVVASATDRTLTISLKNIVAGEPAVLIATTGSSATQKIGAGVDFTFRYNLTEIGNKTVSFHAKTIYDRSAKSGAELLVNTNDSSVNSEYIEFYTNSNGRLVEVSNLDGTMTHSNALTEKELISQKLSLMYANAIMNGIAKILKTAGTKTLIASLPNTKISGSTLAGVTTINLDLGTSIQNIASLSAENDLRVLTYESANNIFADEEFGIDHIFYNADTTARNFNTQIQLTVKDGRFTGYTLTQTYEGSAGSASISFSANFDVNAVGYMNKNNLAGQKLVSAALLDNSVSTEIEKLQTKYSSTNRPTVEDGFYNIVALINGESKIIPAYVYTDTESSTKILAFAPTITTVESGDNFRVESEAGEIDLNNLEWISISRLTQYVFDDENFIDNIVGRTAEGMYLYKAKKHVITPSGEYPNFGFTNAETFGEIQTTDIYCFMQKANSVPANLSRYNDGTYTLGSGEFVLMEYDATNKKLIEDREDAGVPLSITIVTRGSDRFITVLHEDGRSEELPVKEYFNTFVAESDGFPAATMTFGSSTAVINTMELLMFNNLSTKTFEEIFDEDEPDLIQILANLYISETYENMPTYQLNRGHRTIEYLSEGLYKFASESDLFFTISKNSSGSTQLKGVGGEEITYDPATKILGVAASEANYTLLGSSLAGDTLYAIKQISDGADFTYSIELINRVKSMTAEGIVSTTKDFTTIDAGVYEFSVKGDISSTNAFAVVRGDSSGDVFDEGGGITNLSVDSYVLSDTDGFVYNNTLKYLTVSSFFGEKLVESELQYVRSTMKMILFGESADGKTLYAYCFEANDAIMYESDSGPEYLLRFSNFNGKIVEIKKQQLSPVDAGDSFEYDYVLDKSIKKYIGIGVGNDGVERTIEMEVVRRDIYDGVSGEIIETYEVLYFGFIGGTGRFSKFISHNEGSYYTLRDDSNDKIAGIMIPITANGEIIGFNVRVLYDESSTKYDYFSLFDIDNLDTAQKSLAYGEYFMTYSSTGIGFLFGSSGVVSFDTDKANFNYNTNSRAIEWTENIMGTDYNRVYEIVGRYYEDGRERIVVYDDVRDWYEIIYPVESGANSISVDSAKAETILGKTFARGSNEIVISKTGSDYTLTLKNSSTQVTLNIRNFGNVNMLFFGAEEASRGVITLIQNRNGSVSIEIHYDDTTTGSPVFGTLQGIFTEKQEES